ncbi:sulfatase family protein [Ruegeria jejuensis]|uniref:sulfatase family protein n=1 Tax=Ruegeria jejuensis TaxID=3233338 RepID=UPI00355C7097
MKTGPNVILITTDQQRGDCIGLDKRKVRTPHIDALARRGTRFETCITPHPMCQPARASILTGKLPYSHGVRDNGRNLDPTIGQQGLGGMFSDNGYSTHFIGKAHFATNETFAPTGTPECYHSTADFPADWGGGYFGFNDVQLMLRPHHHCVWSDAPYTLHYENHLDADGGGRARWQKASENVAPETTHFQAWRSALDDKWHSSPWIGDQAIDLIDRKGADPFFAWISFPDPHPPFLAAAPWSTMYDPDEVDIPRHRTLDLDRRPWWHRAFLENPVRRNLKRPHAAQGQDWGASTTLTERQLRDITAIYYGMISAIDHQVGRIVAALSKAGQLDNTIIVFTSDHGEWLGDHGLLLKGPMLYDGLLRVPLVIAGPNLPTGRVVADPVSTLDLRSTFAQLCEINASPDSGSSLVPVVNGRETREFALNEWEVDARRSGISLDLRTIRTVRHRMSTDRQTGTGELYDLRNDPDEMHNLFDDPAAKAIKDEIFEMLRQRPKDIIEASPRVGWH